MSFAAMTSVNGIVVKNDQSLEEYRARKKDIISLLKEYGAYTKYSTGDNVKDPNGANF